MWEVARQQFIRMLWLCGREGLCICDRGKSQPKHKHQHCFPYAYSINSFFFPFILRFSVCILRKARRTTLLTHDEDCYILPAYIWGVSSNHRSTFFLTFILLRTLSLELSTLWLQFTLEELFGQLNPFILCFIPHTGRPGTIKLKKIGEKCLNSIF